MDRSSAGTCSIVPRSAFYTIPCFKRTARRLQACQLVSNTSLPCFSLHVFQSKMSTTLLQSSSSSNLLICSAILLAVITVAKSDCSVRSETNEPTINQSPASTTAPKVIHSVLGKCTRCRLLSNSIYENLKNMTVGNRDIKVDHNFLSNIDKLNEMKKQVEFSKIWSRLCFDIKAGRDDCRSLAQENEELISEWWKKESEQESLADAVGRNHIIFNSLCIHTLKSCCPDGHYGMDCWPCIGYPGIICSGNGKCAGAGTRLGNGHCVCRKGYQGNDCSKCDKTFFLNQTLFEVNGTVQCHPCDASCAESCFAGGSRGCHVCKNGYAWENLYGCFDIDECDPEHANPCPRNAFCINTEGAYQCYQCDQACDGCDGDGPDACIKCAEGHELKEGVCVNPNPKPLFPTYASPMRFITYLGLTAVPCIIFRHNIYVASAIGLSVALYIMASERSLDTEHGRAFDTWLQKVAW